MVNRVYGLDILRAFAILFVIYSHSFFLIIDHINERAYQIFSLDGVTLFFVLSGFLIGGILLKTIDQTEFRFRNLLHFWIRRWFRTLPNYYFMLVLLIMIALIREVQLPDNLLSYVVFLQNFSTPHPTFFPEAWSLTVEEWFYLFIPFGLFLTIRLRSVNKKYLVLYWSIGIIIAVTSFRIYRAIHYGFPDLETWDLYQRKLVITRLDSIMFGLLAAWLSFYHRASWIRNKKILLFAGIVLLFIPSFVSFFSGNNMFFLNYLSLTITSLGTFLLLPALSELKNGKGPAYHFLTYVSVISYSMYLVNFSLIQLGIIPSLTGVLAKITKDHLIISIIRYSLYWIMTFVMAHLLYRFYEKPMMHLRERFRSN
jgi:peptidoglycan/LPS O-acetylase OafA/YrhL